MPPNILSLTLRSPLIKTKTIGSWFLVSNLLHLTKLKYFSLSNYLNWIDDWITRCLFVWLYGCMVGSIRYEEHT
ncbi:hypothetical protein Hdeb2414_s0013g00404731 [Helianthus debilis subsp. tardiflorus]